MQTIHAKPCHRRLFLVITVLAACMMNRNRSCAENTNETIDLSGPIQSVTVFRREANVIRSIELQPSSTSQRIRLQGLPKTLRDQSVRWDSKSDITVRSLRVVEHRQPRDEDHARALQAELQKRNLELQAASGQVAAIEQDLETLERLVSFTATKSADDLNQSRLQVESVTQLADFVMQRRRTLAKELFAARQAVQTMQQEIESGRIVTESDPTHPSLTFDAVMLVDAPQGGTLRLSYWVDEVRWEPHYTIHATTVVDGVDRFAVQLDGSVTQNSGENWDGVELAFCTGVPDLQTTSPPLAPLRVSTSQAVEADPFVGTGGQPPLQLSDLAPAWEDPTYWHRNVMLNTQAASRQIDEINRQQSVQRVIADDANQNMSDETYRVVGRIDVADQTVEQAITIMRWNIDSPIYRVVTPLLSSFAYREAALENRTGQSLVDGDAAVFLDGRFVGRTSLPPTAAGGEFAVGLGTDRQVRTRRELLSRDVSIQGGNRLAKLNYRLVLSNFHDAEIDIRLFDRLPITSEKGSVSVASDATSLGNLSDDAKYLRMQRPTGILRWDLTIPAASFGSKSYDHHYSYAVEMDRTQSIVSHAVEQQMQSDLRFNRASGGGMGGGGFGGMMGGGGSP